MSIGLTTLKFTIAPMANNTYNKVVNHLIPSDPMVLCDSSFRSTIGNKISIKKSEYIIEDTMIFSVKSLASRFLPKYRKQIMSRASPAKSSNMENVFFVFIRLLFWLSIFLTTFRTEFHIRCQLSSATGTFVFRYRFATVSTKATAGSNR